MKKILIILFSLIAVIVIFIFAVLFLVINFSKDKIYDVQDVSKSKVGIVFGAKVKPKGVLSEALQNRVDKAIELYQNEKVEKLLFTGDNSRKDYDEVTDMKTYAVDKGVNSDDIKLDYAGFDTYDSCYRAKEIFGVDEAILVTQEFHLPRAIYTCDKLGVKSKGVIAKDFQGVKLTQSKLREYLAIIKAFIEINITHPKPKFLGEFKEI